MIEKIKTTLRLVPKYEARRRHALSTAVYSPHIVRQLTEPTQMLGHGMEYLKNRAQMSRPPEQGARIDAPVLRALALAKRQIRKKKTPHRIQKRLDQAKAAEAAVQEG